MAATYLILIADELVNGPEPLEVPQCLRLGRATLSERHPGRWLVEVTDDDAPEELNAQHVDLIFTRHADGAVTVTERQVVRF